MEGLERHDEWEVEGVYLCLNACVCEAGWVVGMGALGRGSECMQACDRG